MEMKYGPVTAARGIADAVSSVDPLLGVLIGLGTILFGAAAVCDKIPPIIESANKASKKENDK